MPPKAAAKNHDEGKDEVVAAFSQLSVALNNAAKIVEHYTSALSKGGVSVKAAGEGPVVGKKRGRPSAGDELEGGKRKRQMKKEKDPNAPKRPASAYLLYQNDKRAEFVEKHKGITYHEMLSKISESWSNLTAAEKQPYIAAQAKLKHDYEGRKSAYETSKTAAAAAPEVEEEDEDELDASPAAMPTKAATNGEVESEDDDEEDEEEEEAVDSIVAKAKADDDEDEEEADEDSDDDEDEDSETSEDEEPPRKKTKGAAPTSATKKTPAQTPAKSASKPSSKKAAEAPAPTKEKKKRKSKA